MATTTRFRRRSRKVILLCSRILAVMAFLLVLTYLVFLIPSVQSFAASKVADYLSRKSGTIVSIDKVSLRPVKKFYFAGLYIQNYNGDTMLYSKSMNVNIKGFDPFRKSIQVSDVDLKSPLFTMHRPLGDSLFTFSRFINSISGNKTIEEKDNTKKKDKKAKSKKVWQFALGGLDLTDVLFKFEDVNAQTFFDIGMERLYVDVKKADIQNQVFFANKVQIDRLDLQFEKKNEARGPSWTPPIDTPHLNTTTWKFYTDRLEFNDSKFTFDDQRKPILKGLDFVHLDIDDINLGFNNVSLVGDTITADIEQMHARDKSGLELTQLSGHLVMDNTQLEISGMSLQTPNSQLQDYLKLEYGTTHSFEDFIPNVRMDGKFKDGLIAMQDLELFAPELEQIQGSIGVTGNFYGTIDRLRGRNVDLWFGNHSRVSGKFGIDGLPDAGESFIEFRMEELITKASDLETLLPNLEFPNAMPALGKFRATGEFIGFPNDFVAFGNLYSALGNVESDLNLKVNQKANKINYSGKFSLDDFNLGIWIDQQDLIGPITMSSSVKGTGKALGLAFENMDAELDASVQKFDFKNYNYQDLEFNGNLRQGFFEGALETADPNFDQRFEGTIDFNEIRPVFDFKSDIRALDLYALNLVPEPLRIEGQLEINIKGDDIDSVLGTAGFRQLKIDDGQGIHTLDSLLINASEASGIRTLTVDSDPFSAHFDGDFALTVMPDAIKRLVVHYFPESGLTYDTLIVDQDLNFTLSIRDSKELTRLFLPSIGRLENSFLTGSINTSRNEFDIRAAFPKFEVGGVGMNKFRFDVQTNQDQIDLFTSSEQIDLNDKISSPVSVIEGGYRNDSLFFQFLVGRDTDIDRINLNGAVTAKEGVFRFSILPSEIVTRNNQWEISPNNSLTYNYKNFNATEFEILSGEQSIVLSTRAKPGYDSWVDVRLKNLRIGELMTAFQVNPVNLHGIVDGNLNLTNVFGDPSYQSTFKVRDFSIDGLELGTLTALANLSQPADQLTFIGALVGENSVRIKGDLGLNNKEAPINASLDIEKLDAKPFARYLAGVFDEIDGTISGKVNLTGTVKKPQFSGQAHLDDAQLRLMYTNVLYRVPEVDVIVKNNRLVFEPTTILDPYGNPGILTGALYPNTLADWDFENLNVSTDNMLLMETTRSTNPEFYGTALGSGNVKINGDLNDVEIVISASSNKGTQIFIPITYGPSLSGTDFIKFVDKSKTADSLIANATARSLSRVNFKFYLDINELAEVEIDIGDKLRGRGRGSLQLDINNRGDFTMSGIYTVTKGSYAFSLQDVFSKDFDINPNSRITWTGDPYRAQLDVSAVYNARATEWDLISELESTMTAQEIRNAKQPKDVEVFLNLTGLLEAPNVDFDIQVRQGQSGGTSVFDRRLQQIRADKNELSKQVFGLLVMNRFIPDESGITPLLSSASNSVSEFLSKQLSVYVSDWVSQFITAVDVDIKYTNYTTAASELSQQELQIVLSKNFLDDRIYVNVGGNFGVGETGNNTAGTDDNVAGDFEIEYAITPDGRFRVKAFQRTDYDLILGRNTGETGVGLFYSQEFDSLYDLVEDRRKRKALKKARKEEALREEESKDQNTGLK